MMYSLVSIQSALAPVARKGPVEMTDSVPKIPPLVMYTNIITNLIRSDSGKN